MVGLHSSDPATVFLSVQARMPDMRLADLERSLYEDRTLVRILGMRRTMWVVPTEWAARVNSSSTARLIEQQRKRTADMVESAGITQDGESWLDGVSQSVLDSLESRGEATAREITEDVPELGEKITFYKKDGSVLAIVGVSTRVLFLLATEARIIRARPLGSWLSSQYRWSTLTNWLGAPLDEVDRPGAQASIVTAWLHSFGPGTETDIKWWTGWPVRQVRDALSSAGAVEVKTESGPGYLLARDLEPLPKPAPWAALLPSLDPTVMGWKERDWYLGSHAGYLFDGSGNAGPTIWVDGRVVGGWAQRRDGEVAFELLDDVGSEMSAAVEAKAAALQEWLGDSVVTARFRTPHEKALTS